MVDIIIKPIRRIWESLLDKSKCNIYHKYLFQSYWHSKIGTNNSTLHNCVQYFTASPNRGAGIGHQMSNWHAGYWWSQYFGLKFAHTTFAQPSWERFLGYGIAEKTVMELKQEGYKIIRIPIFNEFKADEVELIRKIINSYNNQKVIFFAEQDQPYHDQIGVIPFIRQKFYAAPARKSDLTPFNSNHFNIAIHVRRGDIVIGQTNGDPNLTMRWLDNEYFSRVLSNVTNNLQTNKPVHIYIFSQGKEEDFPEFCKYENVHFFLDLNPESTFLSFVYADLLITSKSSFSYKPALLNIKGKKVCPANFWHSYPEDNDWILADDTGHISQDQIERLNIH